MYRSVKCGAYALARAVTRASEIRAIEDSHIVLQSSSTAAFFGIADGVGAWQAIRNVDPSKYGKQLLVQMKEALHASDHLNKLAGIEGSCTKDLLVQMKEVLHASDHLNKLAGIEGSCTVAIGLADGEGVNVIGIGDVMHILVREYRRVHFASSPQLKSLQQPFQLGYYGKENEHLFQSVLADAYELRLFVQPGDVLINCSDGVTDNLFHADILDVVRKCRGEAPDVIAKRLVERAHEESLNRHRDSPFALRAKDEDILWTKGGRPDDATAVVMSFE
jgi:protein phosphatase PTC7